ncbi:hypothetical protein U2A4042570145 [Corynebacterium striatum]|nr:hypothetical protein U2A4042570145 [Corynebacterium striatum]
MLYCIKGLADVLQDTAHVRRAHTDCSLAATYCT